MLAFLFFFLTILDAFNKYSTESKKLDRVSYSYTRMDLGGDDEPGIEACREIVDDIDWECDVYRNYQEKNSGCDPSNYLAQKWAFSLTDKCVIFEDDSVPSVSFIRFCKELLDKYDNDTRIMMISGLNYEEITDDIPYDYFFTTVNPIWGWASWKRVIDQWDETYSFLDNPTTVMLMENSLKAKNQNKGYLDFCRSHRESGIQYYETILSSNMYLNSGLGIVPSKNMIHNIGFEGDAVHYTSPLETMPKAQRRIFEMATNELADEIKHPECVIEHFAYKDRVYSLLAINHPLKKKMRKIEGAWLTIRHNGLKGLARKIKKKLGNNS